MTKKQDDQRDRMRRSYTANSTRFIIDGKPYATAHTIYTAAVERGWTGNESTIQQRITKGKRTWIELLKPVDQIRSTRQKNATQHKRDEMAEVIAQLDARKNSG